MTAGTIGLVGSPVAGEGLDRLGALRPDRPSPGRARPGQWTTFALPARGDLGLPRLERTTHFSIHQLLAETPEFGAAPPSLPRTLAAYRAQLAHRIHYSGPIVPIDLRV